jgi:hypothetical protein
LKQGETNRSGFHEILRYFGVPLLAVIVVIIAFFATQKQVVSEIRLGTYQILRDATLNQRITLEKYIGLLTTRVELIADYDSDTRPEHAVESLRTELQRAMPRALKSALPINRETCFTATRPG